MHFSSRCFTAVTLSWGMAPFSLDCSLTFTSFWWASGLLLYWTTSNIWGIGQQMITNRLIGPAPQRTVRPPAERRVKRVGGGRTDQAKGSQ